MEGKKPYLIRKKEEKGERGPPFLFFQFAFLKFDGFFSLFLILFSSDRSISRQVGLFMEIEELENRPSPQIEIAWKLNSPRSSQATYLEFPFCWLLLNSIRHFNLQKVVLPPPQVRNDGDASSFLLALRNRRGTSIASIKKNTKAITQSVNTGGRRSKLDFEEEPLAHEIDVSFHACQCGCFFVPVYELCPIVPF